MARQRYGSHAAYGAVAEPASGGRRWWLVVVGLLLMLLALVGGWVAIRGYQSAQALKAAKSDLAAIRPALTAGEMARAQELLVAAQVETQRADDMSHDPLVRLAAKLPVVGATPRALGAVSAASNDLTHGAFVELVAAGAAIDPAKLRTSGDTINLDAFTNAIPHLQKALTGLQSADADLNAIDLSGAPDVVRQAVDDLSTQLSDVTSTTATTLTASQLAVPMLGGDGPRRYFLAIQSNNELRGTGGLLGQWGIITVDHGRVRLVKFAPNTALTSQTFGKQPLSFGPAYAALYQSQPGLWASANLSPHYPYAAQLWLKMYADRTGQQLDGVITTDPVTLSYLLAVTGPVVLPDGKQLSATDVVPYVENGVYRDYPTQDAARKAVLEQVSKSSLRAVLSGQGDPAALVSALAKAAGERRLVIYSTHAAEQKLIDATSVSGEVPQGSGPVAGLAVINAGGNKLDYYLNAAMDYQVVGCEPAGQRSTRITVTMDNTVPDQGAGLPPEVVQRLDLGNGLKSLSAHGQSFDYVQVYAAHGARLVKASQDGRPAEVWPGKELGLSVYRVPVTIDAGGHTVLTFDLIEPASSKPVRTFATPMVKSVPITADSSQCLVSNG